MSVSSTESGPITPQLLSLMFGTMNTSDMKINVDSSNLFQLYMP